MSEWGVARLTELYLKVHFACDVVQPLLVFDDAAVAEEINQLAQGDSTGSFQSTPKHLLFTRKAALRILASNGERCDS